MKVKVHTTLSLMLVVLIFVSCSTTKVLKYDTGFTKERMIFSLKEARNISKTRLIEQLEPYPVIFIGDYHNSDIVHQFTAELIQALGKKYRLHLANEWFTPIHNESLNRFVNNELNEKEFLKAVDWEKNIGYSYESFKPIYQSLKNVNGRMYGINLSEVERKKISLNQKTKMSDEEKSFYNSLDLNTTIHYEMLLPFLEHCHAPLKGESSDECTQRMYTVQVAWDEKMGYESAVLANKVLQSQYDKLIVFIGAMHLESGVGVTMRFSRHSNQVYATILPTYETRIMPGSADFVYYAKPMVIK